MSDNQNNAESHFKISYFLRKTFTIKISVVTELQRNLSSKQRYHFSNVKNQN